MIPDSVAQFRAEYRHDKIGRYYSGPAHFLFTTVGCLVIIGACVSAIHSPRLLEWTTVPLTYLFANFVEYSGHRRFMHRPRRLVRAVYQRHTIEHHHFFTHEAMPCESTRDYKMVLFPPLLLVFFFGLFALPVGALLSLLATPNVARLFVATAIGYFLHYEWLHFVYHLDPTSAVARLPMVGALRRNHERHHELALMGRYNFNLTLPIFDVLLGTRAPR
jgi:hypothetical protein